MIRRKHKIASNAKTYVIPTSYNSNIEDELLQYLNEVSNDENIDEVVIREYPVVYVISSRKIDKETNGRKIDFTERSMEFSHQGEDSLYRVYVGETNNIQKRTEQHLNETRDDFIEFKENSENSSYSVRQYVITNDHFNKSLTLDVENRLIHYLSCVDAVRKVRNRRYNEQGNYYTKDEFDDIFHSIWLQLTQEDPLLFPPEGIILDSALFKASPFHTLTREQRNSEEDILESINQSLEDDNKINTIIFVHGAAGTGKTVLLSHLFYRLMKEEGFNNIQSINNINNHDPEQLIYGDSVIGGKRSCYLLVNHDQQREVYLQIMKRLGLQTKKHEIVFKPATFINKLSEKRIREGKTKASSDVSRIKGKAGVALIDEAHLLLTQKNQGYTGERMLFDIARRAQTTIAVFDPQQVLQSNQRWSSDELESLGFFSHNGQEMTTFTDSKGTSFNIKHIYLRHQMRMIADKATITWIDDLIAGKEILPIPRDRGIDHQKNTDDFVQPYEIRVFDSPVELFSAIKEKALIQADGVDGKGLSRLVATYDWPYKQGKDNPSDPIGNWNVCLIQDSDGTWRTAEPRELNLTLDSYKESVEGVGNSDIFCHPWNYEYSRVFHTEKSATEHRAWAEKSESLYEVGSTFSIQGFDLNYVGVLIGPSVSYDEQTKGIVFHPENSKSSKATNRREGKYDYSIENLRNELNVLLKRGVHGLYLFALDPSLQNALRDAYHKRGL